MNILDLNPRLPSRRAPSPIDRFAATWIGGADLAVALSLCGLFWGVLCIDAGMEGALACITALRSGAATS